MADFGTDSYSCRSLSVIKELTEGLEILSYATSLLSDIRRYLAMSRDLRALFVRREENSVTHCLAKYALNVEDYISWMEEAPDLLSPFLLSDVLFISFLMIKYVSLPQGKKIKRLDQKINYYRSTMHSGRSSNLAKEGRNLTNTKIYLKPYSNFETPD